MEEFSGNLVQFSFKELEEITDSFSDRNYIGRFQFGKLYHGKVTDHNGESRPVTVKIFQHLKKYRAWRGYNEQRVRHEINLLVHDRLNSFRGLVKLYGYCDDGDENYSGDNLGLVYDFKPLGSLYTYLTKEKESFNWVRRINVALRLAYILDYFHGNNPMKLTFCIRNLSAGHILLDEEYNPVLVDFSLISGGIFPDDTNYVWGCNGYIDKYIISWGDCCEVHDIAAFGLLLVMLMTGLVYSAEEKSADEEFCIYDWAETEYYGTPFSVYGFVGPEYLPRSEIGFKSPGCSFVDEELAKDKEYCFRDGRKCTDLAMLCLDKYYFERPTIKEVIKCLRYLKVVRRHGGEIGLKGKGSSHMI